MKLRHKGLESLLKIIQVSGSRARILALEPQAMKEMGIMG